MFIFRVDPSLEMRLWEEHHADELFAVVDSNRRHLRPWLTWADKTKQPEDTRAFIRKALEQFARHDGFHAGIWLEGRIVGGVGLHSINWNNCKTEIGYWLSESAQGRGVMTRSCRALVDYLIGGLKLNRVEIRCAIENTRSRAVPERLGFRHEGVLRQAEHLYDRYVDHAVYSMLAGEWTAARG